MRSLTAHLVATESHGRLPFHPGCPVCQQTRLAGALPRGGLMTTRTQAALATGVIAVSAIMPAAALAAEQEQEHEGTAPTTQTVGTGPENATGFDPGGGGTTLPEATPNVPQPPAPPEAEPPTVESTNTDQTDTVVDGGDGSGVKTPPAIPPPVAPTSTPPSPTPAPLAGTAPEEPPAPATAPGPPAPVPGDTSGPPVVDDKQPVPARRPSSHGKEPGTRPVASTATPPAPLAAPQLGPVSRSTQPSPGPAARPGDRTHTVQPGESLWAIASDLLGAEATPAQIARKVHRLWEMNHDRIGTGDPDLLMIGTELSLR